MQAWPALPYGEWKDTCNTLHLWTQSVGKTALSHSPLVNHWWNAGLRVTARGLGTGTLYEGDRAFEVRFDLVGHRLRIVTSAGAKAGFALEPMSVAQFHHRYIDALHSLGIKGRLWPVAVELPERISLREDMEHASYDPEYVQRFHQILLQAQRVLSTFRARFTGKCSPVLFWWGTFDLACARFSGRAVEPPEGADSIYREGGNAEQSNCGFWPGDDSWPDPMFYAYTYPAPAGFAEQTLLPPEAFYSAEKGEFFLPYDAVRTAADPDALLLEFCQSAYDAGTTLAQWDPALLRPGV